MEEKLTGLPHSIIIEDRKRISVTGISDVGKFDENSITLFSSMGEMEIKGENLQVVDLSIERGELTAEGTVISVEYSDNVKKDGGFFSRLLG